MASIGGVSSGNANSLYGNRNVISGLASGMDTESMIEKSVSGIRLKLSGFQQQQTLLGWKQEAYQGVTDKLVQFSRKYSSYTSATNLLSPSFFNRAVNTVTGGANASKVSATGKTNSEVFIDGVKQLASSTRYQINSGGVLDSSKVDSTTGRPYIEGSSVDMTVPIETSRLAGEMTFNYGKTSVSIKFDADENYASPDEFAAAINEKLKGQKVRLEDGTEVTADKAIKVENTGGKITVGAGDSADTGVSIYVKGVTGEMAKTLSGQKFNDTDKNKVIDLSSRTGPGDLIISKSLMETIGGTEMRFTLDGKTKNIKVPTQAELDQYKTENPGAGEDTAFVALMQKQLNSAFGTDKFKIKDIDAGAGFQLKFDAAKGSTFGISGAANERIGLSSKNETSNLNTSKSLSNLLGDSFFDANEAPLMGTGTPKKRADDKWYDEKGALVNETGQRLDKDGNVMKTVELKINGEVIGNYSRDTNLETVMVDINNNAKAGVALTYSKTTNQLVFTAKESGAGQDISYENGPDSLAAAIFGDLDKTSSNYSEGQDAILSARVNGQKVELTRSSNTFDIDGLSVTVNEAFNYDASGVLTAKDPVSFTTTTDADTVVTAIKDMVKDYNEIVTELRKAFNTLPAQKSNGSKYQPLSDSDLESMSDSAIEAYNEKVKQGQLFGDRDLSALYSKLSSALTPSGKDGGDLRNIGISTDYAQGLTTINLDETKLREMLKTNPDTVMSTFTKVAGEGSSTNGLMKNLKDTLDAYASTEGTKGILINKAGSKHSAVSLLKNGMKDQMDAIEKQMDIWNDKLSTKVDYYTRQFTRLEQVIAQANSQSSSLMGMMGMGG